MCVCVFSGNCADIQLHTNAWACRTGGQQRPEERLKCLQNDLRHERCSVSFEVVTRCMEHHGQVPAGEYLAATAMTRTLADGSMQVGGVHMPCTVK
jgi:hypothetical protein